MKLHPSRGIQRYACMALCALPAIAMAETAEMLPPGVTNLRYQYSSGYASDAFDSHGTRQSLNSLFRDELEAGGLPPSVATIYQIDTGAKFNFIRQDIYLQYGISNDLGIGVWANAIDQQMSYSATLQQQANWAVLVPEEQVAITGATTATDGADASISALGDTVIGIKHRLHGTNESSQRFSYLLGMRLPTGHRADPTNATDMSTGGGQSDIGVWLSWDWQPTTNLLLNLHTRHEYQLAGERKVLDPADSSQTLTQKFQPGFYTYIELNSRYHAPHARYSSIFELSLIYEDEGQEMSQNFDPLSGTYDGGLHNVSDSNSNNLRLETQLGFDLFPSNIPLETRFYYDVTLQGKNALAVEYVGVRLDLYW